MTQEQSNLPDISKTIGRIPSGLFILTACYEERKTGLLASWVQQVSFEPPMVCVAIAKGRPIMPLLSESHQFGLCQLDSEDKILLRKFASGVDSNEDPFLGFDLVQNTVNGSPILAQCMSYLECEVASHMDFDADHDLFIGKVVNAKILNEEAKPFVHLRDNGLKY